VIDVIKINFLKLKKLKQRTIDLKNKRIATRKNAKILGPNFSTANE
jgi:hypothetical protein